MRIKKAIIVGLMLPLVSEICAIPAGAVSYMTTSTARPSTTARMPTLLTNSITSATYSTATNAGLAATCANPLPDRLTSNRCIDRYDSCLRQENVCGEHFELCYNVKQFNKSRIMCQDYLSQCPADAIKAIFGNSVTTSDDFASANRAMCDGESVLVKRSFSPALGDIAVATDSRIGIAIKEGQSWAAANSVKTCSKVADACIQNACKNSPQKCISNEIDLSETDIIEMQGAVATATTSGATDIRIDGGMLDTWLANLGWDEANAKNYIRQQCRETIGTNEWCYRVTNGGATPSEAALADLFNTNEVFEDIMNGVNGRWRMNQPKIREWVAQATKKSVEQCKVALTDCAVNACGEGSRARCYGLAKDGTSVSIKNKAGSDIEGQCKNLIENNQYCKDIFRDSKNGADGDVWNSVWTKDSIGAIAGLDSDLQKAFNEEAVAEMRRSCQAQAEQCVQTECGSDFSRCFITSSQAKRQGLVSFDGGRVTSNNLFAGGFDEVLARDLCILQVKKYDDCINYFDVQYAKQSKGKSADAWATSSTARNAWLGAANNDESDNVCRVSETYMDKVDVSGNAIDATKKLAAKVKTCAAQERSIFNGLLSDISKRANSTLEREANDLKNQCENSNVKGSTKKDYIWASLDNLNSSNEYNGFNSVVETANPFNGFCAVRVTIRSNNSKVISALGSDGIMSYYPKGTTMSCLGLTTEQMEKVEQAIASDVKLCGKGETNATHGCVEKLSGWQKTLRATGWGLGGAVTGGLLGTLAGNALQNTQNKLGTEDQKKLDDCNYCAQQGGDGFSSITACKTLASGETLNKDTAKKMCENEIRTLNQKKESNKSALLNVASKGGTIGSIAGGVLGAGVGVFGTLSSISNSEDQALREQREQAIADFNAKTNINCYIGGRKVASYGGDMTVE